MPLCQYLISLSLYIIFSGSLSSTKDLRELIVSHNEVEVLDKSSFQGLYQVHKAEIQSLNSYCGPPFFKVFWHYATIFTFITFYIHSYNTIIHSFILHHLPRPVFLLAWVGVEQIFFPLLLLWDLHKRFSFVTFMCVSSDGQ